jgi:hypothetical protein
MHQRFHDRLLPSFALLALLVACSDAAVTAPLTTSRSSSSVTAALVHNFNGAYSDEFVLPDAFTHRERAVVRGIRVKEEHDFSNGVDGGSWTWTGEITVDPANPNLGTISGSGVRTDKCCGSITFTVTGNIVVNPDGSAALFYLAVDPRFGPFGSAAYRHGTHSDDDTN